MQKFVSACMLLLLVAFNVQGADEISEEYAYYGFEPEIVTNYISNRKKLGFVRISVELMVKNPTDLVSIERHDPLLRAAIVEILGNQAEDKVKSLSGRDEIRRECYEMVNRLLEKETGRSLVVNLLFTKYLYD
ncbi:flagellar basal body-associated protein FliL [Shewanella sp. OMA3-2]|uniref:flagellar basal body-associated protein FliL n=1 Tax=Shewanella sp. OMA3-2 TaxID=2908650 RepID=UPI001F2BE78B|nr:flagellar basal body-associated protein FliL [Shewanella sp. OMA3-2]UJF22208.1 flagellar basal body-associated protein FliL [Shewanella sp. OMA3-2]